MRDHLSVSQYKTFPPKIEEELLLEDGEKFRLLAYDREVNYFCFIKRKHRTMLKDGEMCGDYGLLPRYQCYRGYVFNSDALEDGPPCFTASNVNSAYEWAEERCLYQWTLPEHWKAEHQDMMYLAKGQIKQNKGKTAKIEAAKRRQRQTEHNQAMAEAIGSDYGPWPKSRRKYEEEYIYVI